MKILCIFLLVLCCNNLMHALEINCEFRLESNCWNAHIKEEDFCLSCIIYNANLKNISEYVIINTERNTQPNLEVKRIKFEGQYINYLPISEMLSTFPNLENINLFHTASKLSISSSFLGDLSHVKHLSFLGNSLSLEDNSFTSAKNLQKINFENNEIETIPAKTFIGLKSLVNLDLSINKLIKVDRLWFQDLINLEVLNLEWNQIKKLSDDAFKNLHNLKVLKLGLNQIEEISNQLFSENIKLEKLTLHNNKIAVIQSGSFFPLENLHELDLSDNICVSRHFEGLDLVVVVEASIFSCIKDPGTSFLF